MTPSLANIDWQAFLGRGPIAAPSPQSLRNLQNQPILITGAGGSIGSALALRLAAEGCRIVLLESAESSLYNLQLAFDEAPGSTSPTFYLGSISDRSLLDEIFEVHRPRFVFHAAAFKHVPLLEEQPLAAIANNVFGTESLVKAASAAGANILLLSTDKAVAPASVMGATKRVAETIVLLLGHGIVLRLGNVLASCGSVAEVFASQIAQGKPLTVTDPAARRYFLTISEAVDQLITAAAQEGAPALFVPRLGTPHLVADLARFMASTLAPGQTHSIAFTHPRAGDKEFEQLWSADELPQEVPGTSLFRIATPLPPRAPFENNLDDLRADLLERDLAAAIARLRLLVPDYTPGSALSSLDAKVPISHG